MNAIREAIKKIEGWKSQKVRLLNVPLNADDCRLLRDTLAVHHTVKSLEICLCEISEDEVVLFAQQMKDYSLVSLQLVEVNMTVTGAKALACAIQECGLKKLDVSFNRLGPQGAAVLANALRDCGLDALLVSRNLIRAEGAIKIAQVLAEGSTTLKTLDVSRNRIGDEGCVAIAKALSMSNLDVLQTDANGITHDGVLAICEAIEQHTQMRHLSLNGNRLEDQSIAAIAKVLPKTKMERLGLSLSNFGDDALINLARAIKESDTMQILELKGNIKITDRGGQALLDAIKTHRTMKTIILDESGLSEDLKQQISKYLESLHSERSRTLEILCAAKQIPRLAFASSSKVLPIDLLRKLAEML